MRVKLLRDSRIIHHAGETVEVSPAEMAHLISVGSAVPVREELPPPEPVAPVKKETRKKTKKAKEA